MTGTSRQGVERATPATEPQVAEAPRGETPPAPNLPQAADALPVVPTPRPTSILTPPVPVTLDPPRHPDAWRVVVETPGLAAGARTETAAARVRLRVLVRSDGSVGDVQIAVPSGRPELDAAAVAAAGAWRFQPARRDGTAIASTVLIWVAFVVGP